MLRKGTTVGKHTESKNEQATASPASSASGSSGRAASEPRALKGVLTRKIRESQARRILLFLSTGNTCRSPMAAAYFKKLLEERKVRTIEVRSAGVMTIPGLLATDESKMMLEPYGILLDKHRSQPLTEEMLRRADMVMGMTPFHVQMALRMSLAARGKTFLLKEYAQTDPKNRPIPDPMGCTLEVYKRCFRQIKQACDRLVEMEFVTGKPSRGAKATTLKTSPAGAPAAKEQPQPAERAGAAAAETSGAAVRSGRGRKPATHTAAKPAKSGRSTSK